MSYKIDDLSRSAACDALTGRIDAGASAGRIEFFTGSAPTATTDGDSGTKLGTCPLSDPSFGAASAGVATANSITSDTSVDASGTPGHFRIKDSNNVVRGQGAVTATGNGGDITFDSVTWIEGGTIAMTSLTLTVPASA